MRTPVKQEDDPRLVAIAFFVAILGLFGAAALGDYVASLLGRQSVWPTVIWIGLSVLAIAIPFLLSHWINYLLYVKPGKKRVANCTPTHRNRQRVVARVK